MDLFNAPFYKILINQLASKLKFSIAQGGMYDQFVEKCRRELVEQPALFFTEAIES